MWAGGVEYRLNDWYRERDYGAGDPRFEVRIWEWEVLRRWRDYCEDGKYRADMISSMFPVWNEAAQLASLSYA